jgi:multidrug efflux system membrane fusion protein
MRWFWIVVALLAGAGYFTRDKWLPTVRAKVDPLVTKFFSDASVKSGKSGPKTVAVIVENVRRRDVDLFLNGLGTVVPSRMVTLRTRIEGELQKVHFTEGQLVKQGDLLAEIDPRGWQTQLEQAEGQRARDEAALRAAQKTLVRYRQLLDAKQLTAQDLDDQLGLVEQAQAAVKTDQALVANAELQLSYCRITAPIAGRIGLRGTDAGNIVRPTDAQGIAVITALQPISVVFTIPQDEIPRARKCLERADVANVEVFGRDFKNKLARGRLAAVDNQVDPATGTLRLKAEFPNDDEALFPNQFVNVRLLVETERNALVVPLAAVQRGPDGPYVYVVQSDETVEPRPVVLGSAEGLETVVLSGVADGDAVVTRGLDQLRSGTKVAARGRSPVGGATAQAERKAGTKAEAPAAPAPHAGG